ncbi:MAG: metallophosphoesterase [Thermodesulforhabdaceae bacterium]
MAAWKAKDYQGILFVGDPHVASFAPGYRRDNYPETVIEKLSFAMNYARQHNLMPVILGDLFHVPRNNPNYLLVELIRLFKPLIPWVLLGNHDKHEARFTPDVSIAVLEEAGVIRLIKDDGPVDVVSVCGRSILLGASPDWTPLPAEVSEDDRRKCDLVVWISHHNLLFDEIIEDTPGPQPRIKGFDLREIPGVDVVVNGHLHKPRPPVQKGKTLWLNPGSLVRIIRSASIKDVKPSITALLYNGEQPYFETIDVPHKPFEEVFYPFPEPGEFYIETVDGESRFIRGLENLALRRTAEGIGLRQFLEVNLNMADPVDKEIWELYQEAVSNESK